MIDWEAIAETQRLAVLHSSELLDSPPERTFDQLAQLATTLTHAPMALISLMDHERQWFKARVGFDVCQTSRDVAFCEAVVRSGHPMIVEDTTQDERFRDNPLVCGAPNIRFYAGYPIHVCGVVLGTLCVLDDRPRQLTEAQLEGLRMLRDQVQDQIALRTTTRQLERVQARFEQLIDAIPEIFWIMSAEGHLEYVSDNTEELWGMSAEQIQRHPERALERVHPEDRAALLALPERTHELAELDLEVRVCDQRGHYRWLRVRAFPTWHDAHQGRIAGLTMDITELKQRSEELEETVAERTAQLRQAQKMEALGTLAGGVAHDFNNLLAVIMSYAELIRGEFDPDDPALEDLDQVDTATSRAASLTSQLLVFSRKGIVQPQDVDLNAAISSSDKMLRRLIGEDIKLEARLSPGELWTHIDPNQLQQVLMNLVVNARDAMPRGGTVEVHTDRRGRLPEHLEGHTPGPWCRLRVNDTGVGIPEEVQDKIFEPFFTTKAQGRGTGLGLSTVFGIVTGAGGHIEIDSEPGLGTCVTVWLPVRQRPDEQDDPPTTPIHRELTEAPGVRKILIVEDDALVRRMILRTLEYRGHQATVVRNGMEALLHLEDRHSEVDIVLADVVMPYMSGVELAQRAQRVHPHLRFLLMTGHAGEAAGRAGLTDEHLVLRKPFGPRELLAALETLSPGA